MFYSPNKQPPSVFAEFITLSFAFTNGLLSQKNKAFEKQKNSLFFNVSQSLSLCKKERY